MALDPALVSELRAILKAFGAAHGVATVPGGPGKALEAWLLMKLAEAAQSSGKWSVELCNGAGEPISHGAAFLTRGGPGQIAAAASGAPGFVKLTPVWSKDSELVLELHGSLQWLGRSAAGHECDVSVLPATIGDAIRKSGGGRPSGLPIAALECKDKVGAGLLDEMRETLARLFDLTYVSQTSLGGYSRIFHGPSATVWGRRSSMYRSYYASGLFGIVRVGPFQAGAQQLGQHYFVGRYPSVYDPANLSTTRLMARFLEVINSVESLV